MEVVLYYAPFTCALAPYVTLTEAGADFEVRAINLRKKQQMTPDYLKVNPKHKVPALVIDGEVLTENAAIHIWVSRNFPQANLLPADPWQELKAISMLSWCSSGLHPYLSRLNSPPKVCDLPGAEEAVRRQATEPLFEGYRIADDLLAGREYFFDHFTAVDAHFFWCFRRGSQLDVDQSSFPNCQAHFDRMQGRASVQKVLAFEKEVLDGFAAAA